MNSKLLVLEWHVVIGWLVDLLFQFGDFRADWCLLAIEALLAVVLNWELLLLVTLTDGRSPSILPHLRLVTDRIVTLPLFPELISRQVGCAVTHVKFILSI